MKKLLSLICCLCVIFYNTSFANTQTYSNIVDWQRIELSEKNEFENHDGSKYISESFISGINADGTSLSGYTIEKTTKVNGDVYGKLIEDNKITVAFFDSNRNQLYINGVLRLDLSPKKVDENVYELLLNENSTVNGGISHNFSPWDPIGNPPYQSNGIYEGNIPIGETVAFAAFTLSIVFKIPASKIGQFIFLAGGTLVGGNEVLNETLLYRTYQYRTIEKITQGTTIPQYAYKNTSYIYAGNYSNKVGGPYESGWWFANRPY